MENPTADVNAPGAEKTPDAIEREMFQTRESITEKVAALESQVLGNIQSVTSGVTEAVHTVKEAVATAPTAVTDTVKQTVAAVRETVRETVGSFSVTECVQNHPMAALGTTTFAGFLAGYFLPGVRTGLFSRPIMAKGHDAPAPMGHTAVGASPYATHEPPPPAREAEGPGLFEGLLGMVGKEVRQLAGEALSTAVSALKQSIATQVPQMVDTAVHGVTDRVAESVHGGPGDSTRVGGPNYAAAAPPRHS